MLPHQESRPALSGSPGIKAAMVSKHCLLNLLLLRR